MPAELVAALQGHRAAQDAERELAADLWHDADWLFAQPTGKPVDPRADYAEWQALLKAAGVRPARLHDARHTAATMLLVLNVPTRARHGRDGLVSDQHDQPLPTRSYRSTERYRLVRRWTPLGTVSASCLA
jgi:integrase